MFLLISAPISGKMNFAHPQEVIVRPYTKCLKNIKAFLRYAFPVWPPHHQIHSDDSEQVKKSEIYLITIMRFGLKIICAKFGEDWTKFEGC